MIAAIASEYRKFFSTRMWWVLTACMFAYFFLMAGGLGWAFGFAGTSGTAGASGSAGSSGTSGGMPAGPPEQMVSTIYGLAPSLGYVFPVIVGAMAVTAEYRHATIVPTFLAEPRRWVVMLAKAIAAVPMGLVIGLIGTLACVGGGAIGLAIAGIDPLLGQAATWQHAGLSVVASAIWALVGVGLGTLITSQVGAIVSVVVYNQLVEPLLRMGLGFVPAVAPAAKFFPGAAAEATTGGSSIYSMTGIAGGAGSLNAWQGALVLAGYGIVFGLVGYALRTRRDVS